MTPFGVSTSLRLGFGCGGIDGGAAEATSLEVIGAAIEAGIPYFDTARMYGEGRAEGILGRLLPSVRDRVIVATKVGILPASRSAGRRALGCLRRNLAMHAPDIASRLPRAWEGHPRFGRFSPRDLEASLDTSLKQLAVDHVDILLLHEASLTNLHADDVRRFVERALSSGRTRAWGVASTVADTRAIAALGRVPPVLQFASDVFDPVAREIDVDEETLVVTHGPLKKIRALCDLLAENTALRASWTAQTDVDPTDQEAIAALLLGEAMDANPAGIVLFSSSRPDHVAAMARAAARQPEPDAITGLRRFAESFDVLTELDRRSRA